MMIEYLKYHKEKAVKLFIINYEKIITSIFFKIKNNTYKNIINKNRTVLSNVNAFIDDELFKESNYGLQKRVYNYINLPITTEYYYSDFLIFLMNFYFKNNLVYLEIGVSVLKNFLLVKNHTESSHLYAFDLNPINPLLKNQFYNNNGNNHVAYFQGDVFDEEDTENFKSNLKQKFNFIYSDASHTYEGILSEFKNIYSNQLEEEFIIYFDDLDFKNLLQGSLDIKNYLSEMYENVNLYTFKIFGWIGDNEPMHVNGIITNLNIDELISKEELKIYKYRKY
jgi:hypothetical protein